MVCLPCFIIPVLLFIWHKLIQPYVLRFWNPWAVKDADGNEVKTEFPFACEGGVCAYKKNRERKISDDGEHPNHTETATEQHTAKPSPRRSIVEH